MDLDDLELDEEGGVAPPAGLFGPRPPRGWKERLSSVDAAMQAPADAIRRPWPPRRELLYLLDVGETVGNGSLTLGIFYRDRRRDGDWTKPRPLHIDQQQAPLVPDPADRRILGLLQGGRDPSNPWLAHYARYGSGNHLLSPTALDTLIPLLCATGRYRVKTEGPAERWPLLQWDDGKPWVFSLEVRPDEAAREYVVAGSLHRDDARMDLSAPLLLLAGGVLLVGDCFARLDDSEAFPWIVHLRENGPLRVPAGQGDELLTRLYRLPRLPRVDMPAALRYEEVVAVPERRLRVRQGPAEWGKRLLGELSFEYAGAEAPAQDQGSAVVDRGHRRLLRRDPEMERAAMERLHALGFKPRSYWGRKGYQVALELAPRNLPRAVAALLREGWRVEAEGKLYRQPGAFNIEVTSGVDWFELHGTVEFGDRTATMPELLAALRRGENTVLLGDGTYGVLPEEWLRRYGVLAGLGTATDDHLRFGRSQVGLLDALLASLPEARCDATLARAREELRRFDGIRPSDAPDGFAGALRAYQRDGLGWLSFLQQFGFGGCLADDMGLGKTVQVLALLESRRASGERDAGGDRRLPSLIVAPRSVIFNWKAEAARFTPKLRMLDHTGAGRLHQPGEHFDDYHVVLTTYGTLRRDAIHLKDVRFDYVILDEAHAIKNAASESAKAARLLRGDHRLALSGTPVQNHLGELWSLFEFLNPGMLGSAAAFGGTGPGWRMPEGETRAILGRALRPFILRRTKEQVARDLPPKTEQTLFCELDAAQRRLYDELRQHYRASLLGRIGGSGIGRSKIQILEALLRLRQAACHPGLLDPKRRDEPCAKLDALLPQLAEVRAEGHKALVFSQFTSLLDIVRARLDRAGARYEYLDGKTRDRAACVERFQRDPDCLLFLVSLRAGGLGLNLTAAEYVFLLDPWWNPAVEAQAIDRTHRIGQTRPVFAYRLIAKDTVEEKVLELQETKRDLADAIVAADESLIRTLTREDLELLLS